MGMFKDRREEGGGEGKGREVTTWQVMRPVLLIPQVY